MSSQFNTNGIILKKSDIINMAYETEYIKENEDVPFPQADNFQKIIDLLNNLKDRDMTKDEVTTFLRYTMRQTDYYTNSAIYLELIEKKRNNNKGTYFSLTNKGRFIFSLPLKETYLNIIQTILEHAVFNRIFIDSIEKGTILKESVLEIMIEENLNITSDSTLSRRAKTIISWIEWIHAHIK